MKARSILCGIFVFFYCFVSDCCSHQQNQHPQPEDHWRWRQNLDVAVRFNNQLYRLPVQWIHGFLKQSEQTVTDNITRALESNIAIAAITIVYESRNEQGTRVLGSKTQWIRLGNRIYYFSSIENTQILDNDNKYIIFSSPFSIRNLFYRMGNTWNQGNILNHTINQYDQFMNLIQTYDPHQNARDFHHSEQKVIEYLSRPRFPPQEYFELTHIINNIGVNPHFLKLIVVHIHSTRDPCNTCSKSLSLFSHYMNHYIQQHYVGQDVKFLTTVSSRRNYENSRFQQGHDNSYSQMITIDVNNNFPPPPLLPPPPPPPLGAQEVPNGIDVIPSLILQTIAVNPQAHPQQQFVFNPAILYFRTVFPDRPTLQHYFQRLNF